MSRATTLRDVRRMDKGKRYYAPFPISDMIDAEIDRLITKYGSRADVWTVLKLIREEQNDASMKASGNSAAANAVAVSAGRDGEPRPLGAQRVKHGCKNGEGESLSPAAGKTSSSGGHAPRSGDSSPEREDERDNAQADSNGAAHHGHAKEAAQASVGGSDTNMQEQCGESSGSTTDDAGHNKQHQTNVHNHTDSIAAPLGDTPSPTENAAPEQSDEPEEVKKNASSGRRASRITRPIASYGGDTGPSWEDVFRTARKNRGEARKVEAALRRLISTVDIGGIEESPRIDGGRLVRELVSRRYALTRAVRREQDVPLIVLACDVSGSCSASCAETLAAAVAIAGSLPNVLVVRHSNGHVIDAIGPVKSSSAYVFEQDAPKLAAFVASLNRVVACVVAWGDWDAGYDLRVLCERGADLFWLDSYCATHGPRAASTKLRAGASSWRVQPRGWWQGVGDAASTVTAIEAMTKSQKRG